MERRQQKEYEQMLQVELDEELKNMKQQEIELKRRLKSDFGGDSYEEEVRKPKAAPVQ